MTKNVGSADKLIRFAISAILAVLFFTDVIQGTLGIVALVVAGVLAITASINFCPLWAAVGFRTVKGK